jgi:hypothetical protein
MFLPAYSTTQCICNGGSFGVVKLIGDKLVRDTPFKYRLTLQSNNPRFNGLHFVDFGRTFGTAKPAVAYAYTHLTSGSRQRIDFADRPQRWLQNLGQWGAGLPKTGKA